MQNVRGLGLFDVVPVFLNSRVKSVLCFPQIHKDGEPLASFALILNAESGQERGPQKASNLPTPGHNLSPLLQVQAPTQLPQYCVVFAPLVLLLLENIPGTIHFICTEVNI